MGVYIQNMLGGKNNLYDFKKELDSFKVWYFQIIQTKFFKKSPIYILCLK